MKIVHIIESFGGGAFQFLKSLIQGLQHHRHIVVYGKRSETPDNFVEMFPDSTEFHFWRNAQREINILKDFQALIELLIILKKIKPFDIVHLHSSKAGFLGRIACRLVGEHNKVIYTTHGISFLRKDVGKWKLKLFIFLERIGNKFGGKVIACSRSEMEEIIKNGISASFIWNSIDCNHEDIEIAIKKDIIIGTCGRITAAKNPCLFNDIAKSFLNNKEVLFLWIGDGELRGVLSSANIRVTGWLSREDVILKLKQIDIYLSTSSWEGHPLSVLEAMCMGKPLILSNCAGNRDLVINGYNGFLYDSSEEAIKHIKNLYNDKNKRKECGKNSSKLFKERFTIDRMIENYEKLYNTIYTSKNNY